MKAFRKNLQRNPAIKFCASLNITLLCLVLLFILTLWGTIDQVYNGLYLAQERFFYSFFFTFAGFIPFPGAQLVLWVFFINLVCVALTRLVYKWDQAGIIVTHLGLLLFFVAAFATYHGTEESHITLREGEGTNVAQAYHDWELAVWTEEDNARNVAAFDANGLRPNDRLTFTEYGLTATVGHYYPNAEAYGADKPSPKLEAGIINASGIQTIKEVPLDKEPEKNIPGGLFTVRGAGPLEVSVLVYGGEEQPAKIAGGEPPGASPAAGGQTYFIQLRRKRYPLPFVLRLKDFTAEWYPNTEIARSYKSLVEIVPSGGGTPRKMMPSASSRGGREVLISMNNPLRYKNFALYQSSYAVDKAGVESSTLAIVRNPGRLLPYFASFITFGGLAVHFLLMAFRTKLKQE